MEEIILRTALVLHLLISILIFAGVRTGAVRASRMIAPVVLLLPFWGLLLAAILHFRFMMKEKNTDVVTERFLAQSETYQGFVSAENSTADPVALEDVMILNTPKERREMMLDILNDNPEAYVDFLKIAGENDDTEVVHYAVTAMVGIAKENDKMRWELERAYAQDPENVEALSQYCDFLWHCLKQGLLQGEVERMDRGQYGTLIRKKMDMGAATKEDYCRCAENELIQKNAYLADSVLKTARQRWPEDEDLILLEIQCAGETGDREELTRLLDELEESGIYLSVKAKEVIAFWRQ